MAVGYVNFSTLHTVAESTDLIATHYGAHIWNIRLTADRDNGVLVAKGAYEGDDVYTEATPENFTGVIREITANGLYLVEVETPGNAVFVNQPVITHYEFETTAKHESQFYNAKDSVVRGYSLVAGDRFALSEQGFTTTPTKDSVGKEVTVDATTHKLVIGA